MNIFHRWYCNSDGWRNTLQRYGIPWALGDADLGDDVLEIGPGPGMSTDWLRERVARLTSIEVDHKLAQSLTGRMAGTNVTVVEGDATDMPFPDPSFSAAVCFTMLHHVPTVAEQDKLLAEVARVLRPGGIFAGVDSLDSPDFRALHVDDICNVIDPPTMHDRLAAAGFSEVHVEVNPYVMQFKAVK